MSIAKALDADQRADALQQLGSGELDVLVVGGGIVGVGAALDAVTRGLKVGLVEQRDLASGTSSRSSKLVHGGLRYLEMFDFALVKEALEERGLLLTRLAPHLVRPVPFLYPLEHAWERPYVGAGVALYDTMAMTGRYDMGVPKHKHVFRKQLARMAPDIRTDNLHGAIRYYDCQVDDARLVMTIARTAANNGAHVATRTKVTGFLRDGDRVVGVRARDLEGQRDLEIRARVVINAAGVWTDEVQDLVGGEAQLDVDASKGIHLVVPQGPDPLGVRLHHQDREVGAVRDPVGRLLDHRHDRHRRGTSTSPTPPPARPTSTTSSSTSTGCSRTRSTTATSWGVRRAPAAAQADAQGGRDGGDHQALPRAHGRQPGARPRAGRRRQADDVPRHGARRGRPRDPRLRRHALLASPTGCR